LGWLPVLAMALGQAIQAITNRRQALAIGPGHRPADVRREAVAVEVDGVDIGTGFGHALFENLRALVDQRQQAALADFLVANLAAPIAQSFGLALHQRIHLGIVLGLAAALG